MTEYTYEDVIINPNDPRVEIGAEYWFSDCPNDIVKRLNNAKASKHGYLSSVESNNDLPFYDEDSRCWLCIIRKKEPEKKYVPFDLNNEKDRAKLRGAWVRDKESKRELLVTAIFLDERPPFVELNDNGFNSEEFLEDYEFLDGTPCGKLVEDK